MIGLLARQASMPAIRLCGYSTTIRARITTPSATFLLSASPRVLTQLNTQYARSGAWPQPAGPHIISNLRLVAASAEAGLADDRHDTGGVEVGGGHALRGSGLQQVR